MKHHALALGFSCAAYGSWTRSRAGSGLTRRDLATVMWMIAAAMTSQFCLPLLGIIVLQGMHHAWRTPSAATMLRSASTLVPIVLIGLLFLHWGGASPPQYRVNLLEGEVGHLTLRPSQLICGLVVLGCWIFPLAPRPAGALSVVWVLLTLVAAFLLVHLTGVYRADASFYETVSGPASTVFRWGNDAIPFFGDVLAACVVTLGISAMHRSSRMGERPFGVLAVMAVYLLMMQAVPYSFEGYYLALIVFVLMLGAKDLLRWKASRAAHVFMLATPALGVIYVFVKVLQSTLLGGSAPP